MNSNKYNIKFYKSIKRVLNVPFKLLYNPVINGLENIPNKPYILAGNHKSMLDIVLLITSIDDEIHFMAKKELFDNFIIRNIFEKMGAFPVDRNDIDISAIKKAFSIIRNGEVLGVFPEGTRNKTDEILLPFKDGVSRIAVKNKALIVPFGIAGEYKRNNLFLNILNRLYIFMCFISITILTLNVIILPIFLYFIKLKNLITFNSAIRFLV